MGALILMGVVLSAMGWLAFRDAAPFGRGPAASGEAAAGSAAGSAAIDAAQVRRLAQLWRERAGHPDHLELEIIHDEAADQILAWIPVGHGCAALADSCKARGLLHELARREAARLGGAQFEFRPVARSGGAVLALALRLGELPREDAALIARLQAFARAACDWRATHWPRCRDTLAAAALSDGAGGGAIAAADRFRAAS